MYMGACPHLHLHVNSTWYTIQLQREAEEKARQPETKPGAIAQTRHMARLRNAKRSRIKHPKRTHWARDRPKQARPRAGRGRALGSGQRHATRHARPTDTRMRCPGKGQRLVYIQTSGELKTCHLEPQGNNVTSVTRITSVVIRQSHTSSVVWL
jgi:hypothetical protein